MTRLRFGQTTYNQPNTYFVRVKRTGEVIKKFRCKLAAESWKRENHHLYMEELEVVRL